MRFIIAAVLLLASVAAAGKGLDPSWSFASTTTITDEDTPWYTVNIPFLTTVTTDVSGTIQTVTKTDVSISIGTKSPNTLLPDIPTNCLTTPCSGIVVPEPVPEFGGVVARSVVASTEELITHTHSHPQSSTIDDSDVLPTIVPISSDSSPVVSSLATTKVTGTTTTSSEASLTTHSSPLGYGGGDETSSTTSVGEVVATTVTVTVGEVTSATTTSTSKSPTPSTFTFTFTYGSSPVETITLTTIVGSSDTLGVTGTATSTTSNIPSMSILPIPSTASGPAGGYGGGDESSSTIPSIWTLTSKIPTTLITAQPPTITKESTTFITVKVASTHAVTVSSGVSPSPFGSSTADPMTGTQSSEITLWPPPSSPCNHGHHNTSFSHSHPTVSWLHPTGNATQTRTWPWGTHTRPDLSMPTQGPSTLLKAKRDAKNTAVA